MNININLNININVPDGASSSASKHHEIDPNSAAAESNNEMEAIPDQDASA